MLPRGVRRLPDPVLRRHEAQLLALMLISTDFATYLGPTAQLRLSRSALEAGSIGLKASQSIGQWANHNVRSWRKTDDDSPCVPVAEPVHFVRSRGTATFR